jgi:hypothetical protein
VQKFFESAHLLREGARPARLMDRTIAPSRFVNSLRAFQHLQGYFLQMAAVALSRRS